MPNALMERMHPSYEGGGSRVSTDTIYSVLVLMIEGQIANNAAAVAAIEVPSGTLTQDEKDEFATLADLMPDELTGLTGLLAPIASLGKSPQYDWADFVRSVLIALEFQFPGYETAADVRAKLGLPTPE